MRTFWQYTMTIDYDYVILQTSKSPRDVSDDRDRNCQFQNLSALAKGHKRSLTPRNTEGLADRHNLIRVLPCEETGLPYYRMIFRLSGSIPSVTEQLENLHN